MTVSTYTQSLLDRLRELLPLTEDEIVQRGITDAATNRIVELRQRAAQLSTQYLNLDELEKRVSSEGVPADDHTLYTDLLEWRAVRNELSLLSGFLENI